MIDSISGQSTATAAAGSGDGLGYNTAEAGDADMGGNGKGSTGMWEARLPCAVYSLQRTDHCRCNLCCYGKL